MTRSLGFAETAMEDVRNSKKPRHYSTLGDSVYAVEVERTSASASFDLGLIEHSNFSGLLHDNVLFE